MTELQQIIIDDISKRLLEFNIHVNQGHSGFDALVRSSDSVLLYLMESKIGGISLLRNSYSVEVTSKPSNSSMCMSKPTATICVLDDLIIVVDEKSYGSSMERCVKGKHLSIQQPDFIEKTVDEIIKIIINNLAIKDSDEV